MALPLRHWYSTWTHPLKWGDSFWVLVAHTLALLGCSRKKFRQGWLKHSYFFQKIPLIFRFVTLSLEILEKTKLHLQKFHKIVLQPLGIPRPKTKSHGNSTWLFLIRWKLHSFLLDPWNFHMLFNIPGNSHVLIRWVSCGMSHNACKLPHSFLENWQFHLSQFQTWERKHFNLTWAMFWSDGKRVKNIFNTMSSESHY